MRLQSRCMGQNRDDRAQHEFRLVCTNDLGATYIVHRSAASPQQDAEAAARALGHRPIICLPFGLSRTDESLIVRAVFSRSRHCPRCSHSLVGLPVQRSAFCPECGLGAAPNVITQPICSSCGYNLSGVSGGTRTTRCPECGSASPFLRTSR